MSAVEAVEAAQAAGLVYVSDAMPGIRRRRAGKAFRYVQSDGAPLRDEAALSRIKALGIPPAWTNVWICSLPEGHIQATGRDAKGRKQYRYHPRWREVRDETKYNRMLDFGRALPRIREQVERDLARRDLPRPKVLATVVRLLETTLIRVGNVEYARANRSFGLTTMRDRHVTVEGSELRFSFRGKSGKQHQVTINDRRLARIVKQCRDIPGYELFQYRDDDGQRQTIDSADVNAYLAEISGADFTAKDFRTWAGTVQATMALRDLGAAATKTAARKQVAEAIRRVAERLGNTPTICRACYVHPAVLNAYAAGTLLEPLERCLTGGQPAPGLQPEEAAVLALLEYLLAAQMEQQQVGR